MENYTTSRRQSTVTSTLTVPSSPDKILTHARERLIEAFRECPRYPFRVYPAARGEFGAAWSDAYKWTQRHRREFQPERDLSAQRFGPEHHSPDGKGYVSPCVISQRKGARLDVTYYPTDEATYAFLCRCQADYRQWDRCKTDGGEFLGGDVEFARGWRNTFEEGGRPSFESVTFSFSPPDFNKYFDNPSSPAVRDDAIGQVADDRISDWRFACDNPDRKWRVVSARVGDLAPFQSSSHGKGKFVRLTRVDVAIGYLRDAISAIWHFETVVFLIPAGQVAAVNAASDDELAAIFEAAKRDGAPVASKVVGPF